MGNKLNKNQWIAVVVSLLAVAAILSASFKISLGSRVERLLNNPAEELGGEEVNKENMTEARNLLPDFESIKAQGESFKMVDIVEGEGKEAEDGSEVTVNYSGYLMDGTKFDSSWDRGAPFGFILGEGMVIKGWDDGVLGMKEGGVRMLVIPSEMAYGDRQIGSIPANSTLVFIVELIQAK